MTQAEIQFFLNRILTEYDRSEDNGTEPSPFWQGARAAVEFVLGEGEDPTEY